MNWRIISRILVLSLLAVVMGSATGQVWAAMSAQTIEVANNEVNVSPNGACSLIEALENANDLVDGKVHADCTSGNPLGADTIALAERGEYVLYEQYGYYYNDFSGLPAITTDIAVQGRGATISRHGSAPSFRILSVEAGGELTLDSVVIEGGSVQNAGGGISVAFGNLLLVNSTVHNNHSLTANGGIINFQGKVTVLNSTISGNSANWGGGLYSCGELVVANSTISQNTARFGGGGIYTWCNWTIATITLSIVSGNVAPNGANYI